MPSPFGNAFMKAIIASPLHPLLGDDFAVITVTSRKTGRRISTPINVTPQDGEFVVISYRNRLWWKNLLDGRKGELHHRGKTFPIAARILDQTAGVAAVLKKYFEKYPDRAKYFGIRTGGEGKAPEEELTRAAADRVVVFLTPSAPG
jgi:deazaflavin-dependent oxidoreductase (nitroreductase family)